MLLTRRAPAHRGCHAQAADDVPMDAIREIKAMRELDHPNVLRLRDVYSHQMKIRLVLDFMPYDLEKLIMCAEGHVPVALMPARAAGTGRTRLGLTTSRNACTRC